MEVFHIVSAEKHLALRYIIQTHEQFDKGGLACTVMPHNGNFLSAVYGKGNVL